MSDGADDTSIDPRRLDADLAEQWDAVVAWLQELDGEALDAPSVLPGWRVRDLAAHVGQAVAVLSGATPVVEPEAGPAPRHDLASYLASYADDAEGIEAGAVRRARSEREDPLGAIEEKGSAPSPISRGCAPPAPTWCAPVAGSSRWTPSC
ncbi:maleylpyruvate isomerase N-terminal domain-containing protein [Litorihabitans aurantiacus]|uniref:Mycothiol-dependent maleylpyruvate isomerase metal-binding domain-containing protein n=1 Tax=Litorihabitans aurantiacus TaxID=1930061 RepID=A0AA37XFP5_9MICO|nr:maleylpyruvate isomerase N-terminal domain-containing protein [Litorihabitans aurantiacus]GMA32462.1 hypothetical protein GCM10025875_24540 [Litorihabitans aurantiacus]